MRTLALLFALLLTSVGVAERPYTGQIACMYSGEEFQEDGSFVRGWFNSFGTFVVISDRLVLTNFHCVHSVLMAREMGERGSIKLKFMDGSQKAGEVIAYDCLRDLALLEFQTPLNKGLHPIPLATEFKAEALTIGGYGFGSCYPPELCLPDEYSETTTKEFAPLGPNFFTFQLRALKGQSGSPVINDKGELCGLLWGSDFPHRTQAYGIRIETILRFLADNSQNPRPFIKHNKFKEVELNISTGVSN